MQSVAVIPLTIQKNSPVIAKPDYKNNVEGPYLSTTCKT